MTQLLVRASRRGDLVIATLTLVAVVMMLVPLPTWLVDALITTNIAMGVMILLASLYVMQPLQFSSLPTVILIATLFRLAITITTTRLILLNADAGEIVTAFGTFVVGGSIAVGLVVFLIITVAQFIVVAKGAERVAEVAARFTLDALPGKQMSIDAELRNGDIDQVVARRLRQQLERESQLFGAMDGAMKFVKGDVIAGIVIILVNLIGGISVGTLQHGMSIGQAASTYSLLTVGDGLVAQIPALLVAVASGIMVTRVASADGVDDLGRQIMGQLLRDPRALSLAAVVMCALSIVPGFPTMPFLLLGAAFGWGAFITRRRSRDDLQIVSDKPAPTSIVTSPLPDEDIDPPTSHRLIARAGTGHAGIESSFLEHANRIRRELLLDLGLTIPEISCHIDAMLAPQRIRIDLDGAPIIEFEMPAGRAFVEGDPAYLELIGIVPEPSPSPPDRHKALWVDEREAEALRVRGLTVFQPAETAAKWMSEALRRYAGNFVGIQETRRLLSGIEQESADLVKEAEDAVPLQRIAEILRRLVSENVPIRNLRPILEALAEWGPREEDVALLTEHVRVALKRQISFRSTDTNGIIAACIIQPSAEDVLRRALVSAPAGGFLDVTSGEVQMLVAQIQGALAQAFPARKLIVLTGADIRRHLRSLLAHHGISADVMAFQEIAAEFSVQPIATISVEQSHTDGQTSLPPSRERAETIHAGGRPDGNTQSQHSLMRGVE